MRALLDNHEIVRPPERFPDLAQTVPAIIFPNNGPTLTLVK